MQKKEVKLVEVDFNFLQILQTRPLKRVFRKYLVSENKYLYIKAFYKMKLVHTLDILVLVK